MQRPTPPPVPPAVGADHLPVVIVTTRRPAKRRGRGVLPPCPTSQDRVERDREPTDVRKAPQRVPLPQEADQPDARVTENVVRMMTEAAKAIRGHDYSAAETALGAAKDFAGDEPELATRVDRWGLLLDYARQLDGHVATAIVSASEGREYTIGDRTIAIIEIGPDGYAYKETGTTRRGQQALVGEPATSSIMPILDDPALATRP